MDIKRFLSWLDAVSNAIDAVLNAIVYGDQQHVIIDHTTPMTPEPTPTPPQPPTPPTEPITPSQPYLWDTTEHARHSVRLICDEEGLTVDQKNHLSATVHCESGYNPKCVHPNYIGDNVISTTDYGIAQVNDYWHIGPGKDFPSSQYVLDNPEACIRWMCKQWKSGNAHAWVCFSKGLYNHYSA